MKVTQHPIRNKGILSKSETIMQNRMLEWAQALDDGSLSLRNFLKQIAVDANVCVDVNYPGRKS